MFNMIFDKLVKMKKEREKEAEVRAINWMAKGIISGTYGEERTREANFKKYGFKSYDYSDLYSVLEVGLINPFMAYEISVDIHSTSSTTDYFKVIFALDDTYKFVKLIHLNRIVSGSMEDAQKFVERVRTNLADSEDLQDCKSRIKKLESDLNRSSYRFW